MCSGVNKIELGSSRVLGLEEKEERKEGKRRREGEEEKEGKRRRGGEEVRR